MKKWSEEDIGDLENNTVLVTGATAGIGLEASRMFAEHNATVIMTGRNKAKLDACVADIKGEFPDQSVNGMILDLASLESIREFSKEFHKEHDKLNILVNNAGIMNFPRDLTEDGFEITIGTNHFGHFALTGLLLDLLEKTPKARVVTVSSMAHAWVSKDVLYDINAEKLAMEKSGAYGRSKMANLIFSNELQRRFSNAGIDAVSSSCHPGWSRTSLFKGAHSIANCIGYCLRCLSSGPRMGAYPTMFCATSPSIDGGEFIGPGGCFELRGYPKQVVSRKPEISNDLELAKFIWEESEKVTGVSYSF